MKKLILSVTILMATSAMAADMNALLGTYNVSGECKGLLFEGLNKVTIATGERFQGIDTLQINGLGETRSMNHVFAFGNGAREVKFEGGSYVENVTTKLKRSVIESRTVFSNPETNKVTTVSTVKLAPVGNELEVSIISEYANSEIDADTSTCRLSK